MPLAAVQNPQAQTESKSAKKKKARAEQQRSESPAPTTSPAPEKAASVSGEDSESPYVKELQKSVLDSFLFRRAFSIDTPAQEHS